MTSPNNHLTQDNNPVVVDMFCGNRGEIVKQIGNAVCPLMAEALTAEYMRELAGVA